MNTEIEGCLCVFVVIVILCCFVGVFFIDDRARSTFVIEDGIVTESNYSHGGLFLIVVQLSDAQRREVLVSANQWRSIEHFQTVRVSYWRGYYTGIRFQMSVMPRIQVDAKQE